MNDKLNREWRARQGRRLQGNQDAMRRLLDFHISLEVVRTFELGLSLPDRRRSYEDAVCIPLRNAKRELENKYLYRNLDGVTRFLETNKPRDTWSSGDSKPYFGYVGRSAQTLIWFCDVYDCLGVSYLAHQDPKAFASFAFACGTHGPSAPPLVMSDEIMEARFPLRVIAYSKKPEEIAHAENLSVAWRQTPRLELGESGFESWAHLALESPGQVLPHLQRTPTVTPQRDWRRLFPPTDKPDLLSIGLAYSQARLYMAYPAYREEVLEDGSKAEGQVCVVVTSDGHVLEMRESKSMASSIQPVWRLSDGTALAHPPIPLEGCSWSQSSIHAFLEEKNEGVERAHSSLDAMLRLLEGHLRASVWLPHDENYALLSLVVACSYAQELFEAVPLVGLVGEKGTGKSELSRAMADLGANGSLLQTFTEAAFVGVVNARRGLVAIDDLERIAPGKGAQSAKFGNLQQLLKMSYKKSTAFYKRCNGSKQEETLCTYGIKVINNTQGMDPIIADRMFEVSTQQCPDVSEWQRDGGKYKLDPSGITELRDELHTWVFGNVTQIRDAHDSLAARKSDRAAEISIPLRAIAQISGNHYWLDALDKVKLRRACRVMSSQPTTLIVTAVTNILAEGYRHLSTVHVINEIRSILGPSMSNPGELEWLNSPNIGRVLRKNWTHSSGVERPFINFSHRLRAYPVREEVLETMFKNRKVSKLVSVKKPEAFCHQCLGCSYASSCSVLQSGEPLSSSVPA